MYCLLLSLIHARRTEREYRRLLRAMTRVATESLCTHPPPSSLRRMWRVSRGVDTRVLAVRLSDALDELGFREEVISDTRCIKMIQARDFVRFVRPVIRYTSVSPDMICLS